MVPSDKKIKMVRYVKVVKTINEYESISKNTYHIDTYIYTIYNNTKNIQYVLQQRRNSATVCHYPSDDGKLRNGSQFLLKSCSPVANAWMFEVVEDLSIFSNPFLDVLELCPLTRIRVFPNFRVKGL